MNLLLLIAMLQTVAPTASMRGVVLTEMDQPIPAARVEITGGAQGPLATRTDTEGRFAFSGLTKGSYILSAKKEGFVRQEYGQKRPGGSGSAILIDAASWVAGITLRLRPAATIAGEIRNEEGEPIANLLVQALRPGYGPRGNRLITVFSSTLTNDLGEYRLYWVDPGDYYVNASYMPKLPTPINPNDDAPRAAYSPTYFPGTNDPVQAQLVHLENSNGRGINFKLARSAAVTVSGTVRGIDGMGVRARISLMAGAESASTSRYDGQTDARGLFEMKGVPSGSYVLYAEAFSDERVGYSKIQVLDIDRPRADVEIGYGVPVGVRLFAAAPPPAGLGSIRISLLSLEPHIPDPAATAIQPDGAVGFSKVQPGDYALSVTGLPGNGYVQAGRSGARDVLEQFVSVQYGDATPLDIHLAFDGGQITGNAVNGAGQPVDDATVVLVPELHRRHRPDQYRVASSASNGQFSIAGIPPGAYKLFAWDSVEENAWMNAEFMSAYEDAGVAVTVTANSKTPAQVRPIVRAR